MATVQRCLIFENINVEFNSFDNMPVLQKSDECVYDAYDKAFVPNLISIENRRFRCPFYSTGDWGLRPEHAPLNLEGISQACVHDVIIRNIKVYYDEKIPLADGRFNVPVVIDSSLEGVEFYNISVSDVTVNGVHLDKDNAIINAKNVRNFSFE